MRSTVRKLLGHVCSLFLLWFETLTVTQGTPAKKKINGDFVNTVGVSIESF